MLLTKHHPGSTQHTLAASRRARSWLCQASQSRVKMGQKKKTITSHYLINFLFISF